MQSHLDAPDNTWLLPVFLFFEIILFFGNHLIRYTQCFVINCNLYYSLCFAFCLFCFVICLFFLSVFFAGNSKLLIKRSVWQNVCLRCDYVWSNDSRKLLLYWTSRDSSWDHSKSCNTENYRSQSINSQAPVQRLYLR